MKTSDLLWVIGSTLVLVLFIAFPGSLRDIPDWGWAVIAAAFFLACLAGMWREGQLGTFAKRGGIALLFLVPSFALISLLPGEEGGWDPPLLWVIVLTLVPGAILVAIGVQTGFFKELGKMFAKHPPACEHCHIASKDLIWCEATAGIDGPLRLSLCPNCLWTEIETRLGASGNRLLVAQPVRNAGGYYSLNVDGIAEWWDPVDEGATTQRVLSAIREITEKVAGRCEECSGVDANICWIPGQAFRGSWDKFSDLLARKPEKLFDDESRRFLCGACTARTARDATNAQRVRLHLVTPPSQDTLIMLPGEA